MYAKEHAAEKQREASRKYRERHAERLKQEKEQRYADPTQLAELREYWRKKTAKWRRESKDNARSLDAKYYKNAKTRAFGLLGDKCAKCGWTDIRALQIDHIIPIGDANRRILNHRGTKLYRDVFKHPEYYQLLCANCNWIKRAENNETKSKSD